MNLDEVAIRITDKSVGDVEARVALDGGLEDDTAGVAPAPGLG